MDKELELRQALAVILSKSGMCESARLIAFRTLKNVYPEMPWATCATVKELDAWMKAQIDPILDDLLKNI